MDGINHSKFGGFLLGLPHCHIAVIFWQILHSVAQILGAASKNNINGLRTNGFIDQNKQINGESLHVYQFEDLWCFHHKSWGWSIASQSLDGMKPKTGKHRHQRKLCQPCTLISRIPWTPGNSACTSWNDSGSWDWLVSKVGTKVWWYAPSMEYACLSKKNTHPMLVNINDAIVIPGKLRFQLQSVWNVLHLCLG